MPGLQWNDDCNIGIEVIDTEHRRLIELANELISVPDPQKFSPQLRSALENMHTFLQKHFLEEEALFAKMNYPLKKQHAQAHRRIMMELTDLMSESAQGKVIKENLAAQVGQWVMDHIVEEDKKYKAWMEEEGIGFPKS